MKIFRIILLSLVMSIPVFAEEPTEEYHGSTFLHIWDEVQSDPYELPQIKVNYLSLFERFQNKILANAKRTIADENDLMEETVKLAHPNGICLAGTWQMTEDSPYTGYFKNGSEALFIGRASTALNATKRGKNRAMALAGKLFPTLNPTRLVKTANFFVVDDLGGTKAENWTGVEMTNEPKVSPTVEVLKHLWYTIKLALTFKKADSNPGIRQVYNIAELGENEPEQAITPQWIMIKAAPGQNIDVEDFRDELRVENQGGEIILEVHAGSKKDSSGKIHVQRLGSIKITESVVSKTCDKRLHFNHPRWRSDLRHE